MIVKLVAKVTGGLMVETDHFRGLTKMVSTGLSGYGFFNQLDEK